MQEFISSTREAYVECVKKYGEVLETVVIEDIFMPKILSLLVENKDLALLESIFKYFEEVAHSDDQHLVNVFSTTVSEILGNDKEILETAKKYMGPKTIQLQIKADSELGR